MSLFYNLIYKHNLLSLPLCSKAYLLLHSMKVNTKKTPPVLTREGFDDDERTVDIASTIYILAYFQTKFKFIFIYFHCIKVKSLFISNSFLFNNASIGFCSCATYI